MLFKRNYETNTSFAIRRIRADFLEEAARIVEAEAVSLDDDPDPTDISYNIALQHAAAAILRSAYEWPTPPQGKEPV